MRMIMDPFILLNNVEISRDSEEKFSTDKELVY